MDALRPGSLQHFVPSFAQVAIIRQQAPVVSSAEAVP